MRVVPCDRCGGSGKTPDTPCEVCGGSGRTRGPRTWGVEVPAGIDDGQRIRIAGAGHAGEAGGGQGDLYVEVRVREDERFARQGTELVSRVPIPVTTAMLGGEVSVPTLNGDEPVKVPSGAQHGDVTVLRKHGLPSLRGGSRGDQHVVFELEVPRKLSRQQREQAERLAETLEGQAPRRR